MAIKQKNKVTSEFSMSSMTDIVFLLLIFFMVTSTLVNPNALKLLLPKSSNQTQTSRNITLSINGELQYFLNRRPVGKANLQEELQKLCYKEMKPSISLYVDQEIPTKHVVEVMDLAKDLKSKEGKRNCKLILATRAK